MRLLGSPFSDPGAPGFGSLPGQPRHFKGVPGAQTDIHDCQWLNTSTLVGLLRGSSGLRSRFVAVRSILPPPRQPLKSASRQVRSCKSPHPDEPSVA